METWESRLNPTILQPFNLNKKCFPLLPSEHFLADTPLSAHPLMMHSKGAPPRSRFPNVARLRTCHLWRPATLSAREGISAVHLGQKQQKAKVTREIFVMQKKIFKKIWQEWCFCYLRTKNSRWDDFRMILFFQTSIRASSCNAAARGNSRASPGISTIKNPYEVGRHWKIAALVPLEPRSLHTTSWWRTTPSNLINWSFP